MKTEECKMTMTNTFLVISEAISKGAKPMFTAAGQQAIAEYLNNSKQEKEEKVAN